MQFFPRSKFWQYGWGKKSQVFMETSSNRDGYLGGIWQKDKSMTKQVLRNLGVPVPSHVLVGTESDLPKASESIGFPCVVKPLAGGGGRGVTANIRNLTELAAAFEFARGESRDAVMVEQMVQGSDHRLMVIDQKLVAVIGREPSFVIGDGKKTIRALLAEVNSTRSSNLIKSRYLYPIAVDETLQRHLGTQGHALDDKLPKGKRVTLRSNANRSTGGVCTNKTAEAHPEVVALAEQIAAAFGLYAIGIDYLTTDISLSPAESGGRVIEVNSVPGLSALVAAGFDEEELGLRTLGRSLGSIPVDMVIVDEQQAASRAQTLMSRALEPGHGVACGSTAKIGMFNLQVALGNSHPWAGVQTALKNRTLESLEIIATADEITRHGLPVGQLRSFTIEANASLPKVWGHVVDAAVERWKCFGVNH
jgi:cyanophycin synthetase